MNRRQFVKNMASSSLFLAATPLSVSPQNLESHNPAVLESDQELVLWALDPNAFRVQTDARQVLEPGQKSSENPILRPRSGQWDGTRCKVYGTVLYDPQDRLFKMWYSGTTDTPDAVRRHDGAPRHVGYAFSEDGIHWERPNLGLVEFAGSRDNNLICLNAQAPSVFLQTHEADPQRRFLMLTEAGLDTARNKVLYGPDGLHWVESNNEPIISRSQGRTHEPFSILYDPREPDPSRRWKGYSLLHVSKNGYRGRAVGLFLGTEPERWVEYPTQPIMSAVDGLESEIHIPHVTRFHDLYVMLYDAMEPNHHTQTEIALSRDGIHFQRIQNGVKLLPNGRPGEPDAGKICVSPRSLFVHEGKIWWYYTMSADTYQTGPRGLRATPWYRYTGLAQWREDGFASLRLALGGACAEVATRAVRAKDATRLKVSLNAEVPPSGGGIAVELLDGTGNSLATSKPWVGDHVRGEVEWHKQAPVVQAGQTISLRLRFTSPLARIFALKLQGATLPENSPLLISAKAPATGKKGSRELWRFAAGAKISGNPAVDDGRVFFGSWDQHLYALDAHSGQVQWKYDTGNVVTTRPAIHGSSVITASRSGQIFALETTSGQLRWKIPVSTGRTGASPNGSWVDASPTVGAYTCGSTTEAEPPQRLFVGCDNRDLHAFNLKDGTEEWRFPTYNWILSQPAVANYKVYFGSLDGRIYAVDARCGALAWFYTAGQRLRYSPAVVPGSVACEGVAGSPLVVDETLFCGADDGFLYALDASTGQEQWVFQTQKWIWGRPLWVAGVLVVASADGGVYGLDAASGKRLWVQATENANYADVVAAGKLALVACTSGHLYAMHPATGEVAWTFEADGGLRAAPAVDAEGIIYLPTCAGSLIALKA
jgi:outer membrane protein assembly factor BamB